MSPGKSFYAVLWPYGHTLMARSRTKGLSNPSNGAATLFGTRDAARRAIRRAMKAWGDTSETYRVVRVSERARQP